MEKNGRGRERHKVGGELTDTKRTNEVALRKGERGNWVDVGIVVSVGSGDG